jgi:hypothetical protein
MNHDFRAIHVTDWPNKFTTYDDGGLGLPFKQERYCFFTNLATILQKIPASSEVVGISWHSKHNLYSISWKVSSCSSPAIVFLQCWHHLGS